ncbi:MAG: tetratricopeptide repeat protein, partial [Chitinispirillales bacterium]|nr:tetratricopeptide repeat protein [Chitinispirillales bacterium]
EKAASLIEDFLRGPPVVRDADLAHRRGVLVDARNPDAAIRIFEQNTQTYPRDHRNFMRAGLYFARNNRNPARALTMFERTVALNDTIARAWYELGMQYGRARRDRDMTNAFQRFIALESRNPDPIMRVGEYLLVGRNMPGDALMFLEMANSLRPNHPATMVLLARCYTSVGRTEEGIRILESVVRNSRGTPVPIEVRIALAEGYLAVGKNMEAATAWKLVTDEKREVPHLVSYATALLGINRNQEALGIANEILVRDAQNIDALMILGRARAAMRNFEDAMDAYRRIGLINPNHVPALYERANVFLHQQNFDQARTLYARTLELDPKFALGELGLARVARGQRNQAEYQNRLQRAHALDPNHREIQEEVRRANQARSQ